LLTLLFLALQNGLVERRGKVLHVYRSLFVFLHTRDALEHGGVFVSYARNLESTAPRPNKPKVGMGMNPAMAGGMPQPQVQTGTSFRPDQRINRRVAVTRGTYKGNTGMIKDVTGQLARVELHSNNKVITVELAKLKEQMPDGTLVELQERRGDGPPGARGGSGYGGRNGFERAGSTFSQGPGMAPGGGGGYGAPPGGYGGPMGPPGGAGYGGATVYGGALGGGGGTGMYGGGRTPAPNFSGGRTPAPVFGGATPHAGGATPAYGARGGAFDPSGRTPAYPGAAGGAFDPSGRTPGYGGGRTPAYQGAGGAGGAPPPGVGGGAGFVHPDRAALAAGGSSRTPYYNGPTQAPPAPSFAPSGANAFNPSSRTPYGQPGLGGDGGKTPDPRRAAAAAGGRTPYGASGGRTPAYGAKNGYSAASAPTPAANAAPTPAASGSGAGGWDDDEWAASGPASAPTPAAPRGGEYAGAPTPAAGAPTPGAYLGAPTPGVFAGAPTPAAYPSGPTPGGPGAYGASAQTPAGGAYPYQTPYAGAATSAAEPPEERQASVAAVPPPSEWVIEGVRIICKSSAYQGDRLVGQYGASLVPFLRAPARRQLSLTRLLSPSRRYRHRDGGYDVQLHARLERREGRGLPDRRRRADAAVRQGRPCARCVLSLEPVPLLVLAPADSASLARSHRRSAPRTARQGRLPRRRRVDGGHARRRCVLRLFLGSLLTATKADALPRMQARSSSTSSSLCSSSRSEGTARSPHPPPRSSLFASPSALSAS